MSYEGVQGFLVLKSDTGLGFGFVLHCYVISGRRKNRLSRERLS